MENELNGLNGSNANNISLQQNNQTSLTAGASKKINNPNNQKLPPIPPKPEGLGLKSTPIINNEPINEVGNKSKSSKSETLKFIGTQIKAGGKSVGAKIGYFLRGALVGLMDAAFFVATKPLELGQGHLGIKGPNQTPQDIENETLKVQVKEIDTSVAPTHLSKGNKIAARVGGVLGGLVGAAIGVGLSLITGIVGLVAVSSRIDARLNLRRHDQNIGELIKKNELVSSKVLLKGVGESENKVRNQITAGSAYDMRNKLWGKEPDARLLSAVRNFSLEKFNNFDLLNENQKFHNEKLKNNEIVKNDKLDKNFIKFMDEFIDKYSLATGDEVDAEGTKLTGRELYKNYSDLTEDSLTEDVIMDDKNNINNVDVEVDENVFQPNEEVEEPNISEHDSSVSKNENESSVKEKKTRESRKSGVDFTFMEEKEVVKEENIKNEKQTDLLFKTFYNLLPGSNEEPVKTKKKEPTPSTEDVDVNFLKDDELNNMMNNLDDLI